MPIITLEVMSSGSQTDDLSDMPEIVTESNAADEDVGKHFINVKTEEAPTLSPKNEEEEVKEVSTRSDLLEYVIRTNGTVICKTCGEILQSRTHWYRHKYKRHVMPTQPLTPAPLFQCELCLVFFKSRKGYIGHLASRHSETLTDASPVLSNTQLLDANHSSQPEKSTETAEPLVVKEEPDPELPVRTMPLSAVLASQDMNQATVVKQPIPKSGVKRFRSPNHSKDKDWKEKRSREEKLVADIIDRVRRECEAQGSGGPARRGYSRRTTVMHS